MRLFVAIPLAGEAADAVGAELQRLRDLSRAVAWVPPANLHLTLRFLGEQPPGRVPEILDALRQALRGGPAPFSLTFQGVGAFPGLARPRILWVGVAEGADLARSLQARVARALDGLGLDPEGRPWHPHLTIGRVFDDRRWRRETSRALEEAVGRLGTIRLGTLPVRGVSLMRSELSRSGARYTVVGEVPLGGA